MRSDLEDLMEALDPSLGKMRCIKCGMTPTMMRSASGANCIMCRCTMYLLLEDVRCVRCGQAVMGTVVIGSFIMTCECTSWCQDKVVGSLRAEMMRQRMMRSTAYKVMRRQCPGCRKSVDPNVVESDLDGKYSCPEVFVTCPLCGYSAQVTYRSKEAREYRAELREEARKKSKDRTGQETGKSN